MREQAVPVVFAAVLVLLQILVAPVISFSSAIPSFIVPFVILLAIMRAPDGAYWYAFVMGLIADLLAQTPLGLTPLLLLISAFVLGRAFEVLDATTPTMPLIALAIVSVVFELVFMIVLLIMGYEGSFFELFLYRALPSIVFDLVIGVVLYFIMRRLPFAQVNNSAWRVSDNERFR